RAFRGEILAQARLELLEPRRQARRTHELQRQLMDLLDERVVLLCDGYEILELPFELRVARAQHCHLALDEGDGGPARAMRQFQRQQQQRMALEELGVTLQIFRDGVVRERVAWWRPDCRADLLLTHSSMYPSYTAVVAPVCHSGEPGPGQLTVSSPPGRLT